MSAATDTLLASLKKVFVLSYDAMTFERLQGKSNIRITGRGGRVNVQQEPIGTLGVFHSEAQAKIVGKAWLYCQFDGVEIQSPCLDGSQGKHVPPPGSWTRSGDERSGWQDGEYSITDFGRTNNDGEYVALIVGIEEWDVNQVDEGDEGKMLEEAAFHEFQRLLRLERRSTPIEFFTSVERHVCYILLVTLLYFWVEHLARRSSYPY